MYQHLADLPPPLSYTLLVFQEVLLLAPRTPNGLFFATSLKYFSVASSTTPFLASRTPRSYRSNISSNTLGPVNASISGISTSIVVGSVNSEPSSFSIFTVIRIFISISLLLSSSFLDTSSRSIAHPSLPFKLPQASLAISQVDFSRTSVVEKLATSALSIFTSTLL